MDYLLNPNSFFFPGNLITELVASFLTKKKGKKFTNLCL